MSNEHKDWMRDKIEDNKELCRKYPFLIPRNRFTDEIPENFDYSWIELDAMPDGWRTAFGEQMCEEIAQALIKNEDLERYRILQIKEKYGELRWYDKGATQEVYDIIEKYSLMSSELCIECGKPATVFTKGWIFPYCNDCATKYGGTDDGTVL